LLSRIPFMPYNLSDKFVAAIARSATPKYALATKIGVAPSWLSEVLGGYKRYLTPTDKERLRDLARILGVSPDEVFEAEK
jgi:transcriptional regulator with XRE-family HTH domain